MPLLANRPSRSISARCWERNPCRLGQQQQRQGARDPHAAPHGVRSAVANRWNGGRASAPCPAAGRRGSRRVHLVGVDLFEQTLATVGAQAPHVRQMRRAIHRTRDRQPVLGHDHVFTATEPSRPCGSERWSEEISRALPAHRPPCASRSAKPARSRALPNPAAGSWKSATIDDGRWLNSIACPSVSLCVAGDTNGHVVTSTDPAGGPSTWTPALIDGNPCTDTTPCSVEQIEASDGTGLHTLDSGQFPGTGPFLTGLKLTSDVLSWSHAGTPPTVTLTPDHRNRQPLAQRPGRWLTRVGAGWRLVA